METKKKLQNLKIETLQKLGLRNNILPRGLTNTTHVLFKDNEQLVGVGLSDFISTQNNASVSLATLLGMKGMGFIVGATHVDYAGLSWAQIFDKVADRSSNIKPMEENLLNLDLSKIVDKINNGQNYDPIYLSKMGDQYFVDTGAHRMSYLINVFLTKTKDMPENEVLELADSLKIKAVVRELNHDIYPGFSSKRYTTPEMISEKIKQEGYQIDISKNDIPIQDAFKDFSENKKLPLFISEEIPNKQRDLREFLSTYYFMDKESNRYRLYESVLKSFDLEDKAFRVIQDIRRELEEKTRWEEEKKSLIKRSIENKGFMKQEDRTFPENLDREFERLQKLEERYMNLAKRLGIKFTKTIENRQNIEGNLSSAKENLRLMSERLSQIDIDEEDSKEDVDIKSREITDITDRVKFAKELTSVLEKISNQYDEECSIDIKRSLDYEVRMIIKNTQIEDLKAKKQDLESKKVSALGKIFGEEKIRQAQLENIDLQIKLKNRQKLVEKESYSIHDTISDLAAYANNERNGIFTKEMQDIYGKILRRIYNRYRLCKKYDI